MSGSWKGERPPATSPGLLIYIIVDSVAQTIEAIVAHGGQIMQPVGCYTPGITARFRDPAGNVIGLYQGPSGKSLNPKRRAQESKRVLRRLQNGNAKALRASIAKFTEPRCKRVNQLAVELITVGEVD